MTYIYTKSVSGLAGIFGHTRSRRKRLRSTGEPTNETRNPVAGPMLRSASRRARASSVD